jgi:hypothetical protein
MPEITLSYRFAVLIRRCEPLHSALRWFRRSVVERLSKAAKELLRFVTRPFVYFGPPSGLFSVCTMIEGMKLEGRVILEDQGSPHLPERSLQVQSGMRQHLEQPWPILWSRHGNARLVGSSLALMDERKRLSTESVYHRFHINEPAYNNLHLPSPTKLSGRWTSIVSWWCASTGAPAFSHWIMDALPRLALLKEFPSDTGILVSSRLAGYQKESLELLGLLDRVRYTPETHLIVEDYYFSAPTSMIACYNPYSVQWLRSAFLPLADKSYQGPKRFIIQRKGKTRGILNEEEVNAYFQKLGWEIIDTEKLTFAQEIQLFSQAEAFAGVLGSGFTNAIWSSPGCQVITFVADSWKDGWVEWICDVNKLGYHWELFPSDPAMMVTVDLPTVRILLKQAGVSEE